MKKLAFPKKKKLISLKRLEALTWNIFSRYIRLRDSKQSGGFGLGRLYCYTCGKLILTKQAHAGHFIHKRNSVRFLESNVHAQCSYCNTYLHGNLINYTLKMVKDYGKLHVEELRFHTSMAHKFTRDELEQIKQTALLKIDKLSQSA